MVSWPRPCKKAHIISKGRNFNGIDSGKFGCGRSTPRGGH